MEDLFFRALDIKPQNHEMAQALMNEEQSHTPTFAGCPKLAVSYSSRRHGKQVNSEMKLRFGRNVISVDEARGTLRIC